MTQWVFGCLIFRLPSLDMVDIFEDSLEIPPILTAHCFLHSTSIYRSLQLLISHGPHFQCIGLHSPVDDHLWTAAGIICIWIRIYWGSICVIVAGGHARFFIREWKRARCISFWLFSNYFLVVFPISSLFSLSTAGMLTYGQFFCWVVFLFVFS